MTLLVLDIHVPLREAIHSEGDLAAAFCTLMPKLLTYFLSFLTLGIFWTGQSAQYSYIERSDRHLNWISLFFLLAVSILPFTTAFLGEFIHFRFAIAVYWFNILMLGVLIYIHWVYAERHGFVALEAAELAAVSSAIRRRVIIAQLLYGFGALLCFVSTYLSIAIIIVIQLNYALAIFEKRTTPPQPPK
jgi:uncharacterized membrane protein